MNGQELKALAIRSLTNPRGAAQEVMAMDVPMPARWQMVALMAALTAAVTAVSLILAPPQMPLPLFFANPILMAGFVALSMIGVAWLSALIAPALGGQGGREVWRDLLLLFAWVQALRVAAQVVLLVVSFLPGAAFLGALLGMAASVAGVWISVMFATEATRLSSAWKGLLLLAVSGLAIVLLMSIVWAVIGPVPEGFGDV